ncbi:MAG: response regulator transcription factor [Chloroflexi bacterium]|nr:response regulator transcription factor [Chloroflexota bacterium]
MPVSLPIKRAKILVVGDVPTLLKRVESNLAWMGYQVRCAENGQEGLALFQAFRPDLVILSLTNKEGWRMLEHVRQVSDTPVLLLGAKSGLGDRLRGLSLGADDFLPKPFHLQELMLRVQAILRRSGPGSKSTAKYANGYLEVSLSTFQVKRQGQEVDLSPQELRLLSCLVQNAGRVVPAGRLLPEAAGSETAGAPGRLRLSILRLRGKLEPDPSNPRYITCLRGQGYRFNPHPRDIPARNAWSGPEPPIGDGNGSGPASETPTTQLGR